MLDDIPKTLRTLFVSVRTGGIVRRSSGEVAQAVGGTPKRSEAPEARKKRRLEKMRIASRGI
jgi:hypothetical protein